VTRYPRNSPDATVNLHFAGFSFMLWALSLAKLFESTLQMGDV